MYQTHDNDCDCGQCELNAEAHAAFDRTPHALSNERIRWNDAIYAIVIKHHTQSQLWNLYSAATAADPTFFDTAYARGDTPRNVAQLILNASR